MTMELEHQALSALEAMDSAFAGQPCHVVTASGTVTRLALHGWLGDPDAVDEGLFIDPCAGRTLDIGCGPGRLTAALTARGLPALGIDVSPEAVRMTRQRGARARRGDVFGPVPEEGRWATALLADGNIGIGGDPARLLARVRDLLAPDGVAIVELEAPGTGLVHDRLRLRLGDRESVAFDWALVGVDAIDDLATEADLSVAALRESGGRHAALLTRSQIG